MNLSDVAMLGAHYSYLKTDGRWVPKDSDNLAATYEKGRPPLTAHCLALTLPKVWLFISSFLLNFPKNSNDS